MPADQSLNGLRGLLILTAKARNTCRTVCGRKAQLVYMATNLYGVLRRLQQEASTARSALSRPGTTCNQDLEALCTESSVTLNDTSSFLLAYKALGHYEDKLLGDWEFASFTDRQKDIIDHFGSEIMRHAYHASRILIVASTDSLGELQEQLDYSTGYPLSAILNDLTARLMANGDVRLTMLVDVSENEPILWVALRDELLTKALSKDFLKRHRKIILRYVRALERRSAFTKNSTEHVQGMSMYAETCNAKRTSPSGKDENGGKRPRTNKDASNNESHNTHSADPKFFRFRDPREAFGPGIDHDLLADFVEEDPESSQEHSLSDSVRSIYRALCEDYEPLYEMIIFRGIHQHEQEEKECRGLTHDLEKRVVMALDNLELGQETGLRKIRKMVIDKAQRMLDDLEKIKVQ
ncbi:MAG: hypothetical protein Q9210_001998 [Variospora velana]